MKMRTKRRVSSTVWTAIGILLFAVLMFPIYWMFAASLMTEQEIFEIPPKLFSSAPSLTAYATMLGSASTMDYWGLFKNSLVISGCTMVISVCLSVPASYALAKFNIKGTQVFIMVFLISQMLPAVFNLIPYFVIFKRMGIFSTYLAPIVADCTMAIPFSVIMLRPYFLHIPKEIEEAARIDGCGYFRAFRSIMLPICAPGVAVSFVFSFLFAYGDMMYSKTFLGDSAMWPLTTGIYNAIGRYGIQWTHAMAFAVMVVLPVVVIFIAMQKYIVEGLASGSVKG